MTFSRDRLCSKFVYYLNGETLNRNLGPIKDLGIFFDSKLKFDCHINNVVARSNQILGFIRRNCNDFHDILAIKSIYCCLVRSICEYGSIIWSPYTSIHKNKIESIQQKFLRFVSFQCSIPREPHSSYTPLLTMLSIETLEQRRLRLDVYFAYKLFSGSFDCPTFLSYFSFHVPIRNTRSLNTFYLKTKVTNYISNTPHNRIMKTINELKIDLFKSPNFNSFKNYYNSYFVNT